MVDGDDEKDAVTVSQVKSRLEVTLAAADTRNFPTFGFRVVGVPRGVYPSPVDPGLTL